MVNLNCNNFRNFIKCLEPANDALLFRFLPDCIQVKAMGGQGQSIVHVTFDLVTGYSGDLGFSLEMFNKLLPKEVPVVDIVFGKETLITAPGFSSKVTSINEVDCAKIPKKDIELLPSLVKVNAQQMYERLVALHKAFDSVAFDLNLEPGKTIVEFSDSDSGIGAMTNSIPTAVALTEKESQIIPYDTTLPILNAVRLITDGIQLRFMQMPSDPGCKALVIVGESSAPENKIRFNYVIAPRAKV